MSHNQQQIVFGKKDGLYLLDLESLTEEKIVDIDPTDKIYPTVPHWSADDSKLVFHTFSGRNTTDNLDFKDCLQIYVYDIKSKTLNELTRLEHAIARLGDYDEPTNFEQHLKVLFKQDFQNKIRRRI